MTQPQGMSAVILTADHRSELIRKALYAHLGDEMSRAVAEAVRSHIVSAEDAARADERVTAHNWAIGKVALMECTWCNNLGPPKRNAATGWWEHKSYGVCEANKFLNLKLPEAQPVKSSEGGK